MATTTTFTLTPQQVIFSALRLLGVIELGVTPDTNTLNNGLQVLNIMLKAWQTQGIKIWTIEELLLTPVQGQQSYIIGPSGPGLVANKPLRIIQAFLRDSNSNTDRWVMVISKNEYNLLGNKQSQGAINSIFYDAGVSSGTLYTYNAADQYSAQNTVLHMFSQRPIEDLNLVTDPFDLPQEWMQALRWGLAAELMMEYGVPIRSQAMIQGNAEKYKMMLENWDVENPSSYFNPDIRSGFIRM